MKVKTSRRKGEKSTRKVRWSYDGQSTGQHGHLLAECCNPAARPGHNLASRERRESAYEQRQRKLGNGKPAPFDSEAT